MASIVPSAALKASYSPRLSMMGRKNKKRRRRKTSLRHRLQSPKLWKFECMCCFQSSESSAEKDKLLYSMGPQTPLVGSVCDINSLSSWSKCSPLPTPEERMKQQALSVATDIVPINITGENFDRQASFRRTLINTDTIIRRSKRVKRRKTITGVPDNIQKELATTEQSGIRSQSMYMPDQHTTLGRVGSVNSTLKNLITCDSGCQTEEIKILPPSMRRIRTQKGQGIAVQLANISLSSSGSMSNMSDYNVAVCTPQFNKNEQAFHSLPRQGARNSVQQLEPKCSNYLYQIGSTCSLPSKVNMNHASPDSQLICESQKCALITPKSEEYQAFQAEHKATVYRVFTHNNSPAILGNDAAQQNSRNIAYSAQNLNKEETPPQTVSPCSTEQLFGSSAASFSAGSSYCHSPVSLHIATHTNTESHSNTFEGRTCNSHNCDIAENWSTLITDQWTCNPTSNYQHAASCSSPVSHNYCSLERLPRKLDSSSLFSPDAKGCYTSMHLESGHKSYSHGCISKASKARHNLYECRAHHSQDDSASLHSNQTLTRSISLRKAKKPPLPPRRTDSLQRRSQQKPHHNEDVLNEQLISSLHKSLTSHTELSFQMPFSGFEDPWVLRPRSHSTVSAASSGMSAPAVVCPVTPTHSDSSSQHSEYAELCDVHPECFHLGSDQGPSFPVLRSKQAEENSSQVKNTILSKDCRRSEGNSAIAVSPDKIPTVTSPSSGYSSQSITPTMGTPVVSFLRAKSPAGRPKPKVPERKSSLRSNCSSSCTSLSSNTSDSIKNLPTPPPISRTLATVVTHQSASSSPISSSVTKPKMDLAIPPLFSNTEIKQNSPTATNVSKSSLSLSPGSLYLPRLSAVSEPFLLTENEESPLALQPPSAFPLILPSNICPQSPLLPESQLQTVTSPKTTELQIVETVESEKEPDFRHHEKPEKHEKPLITAQALQMVQLRPIKLINLENIFTDIITTVCDRADNEQNVEHRSSNKSAETELLENCVSFDSASPLQNEIPAFESPVKTATHNMLSSHPPSVIYEPISNTKSGENIQEISIDCEVLDIPLASQDIIAPPVDTLQNQNPSISSKPSLKMPPFLHHPPLEVADSTVSSEPDVLNGTSMLDSVDLQKILLQLEFEQLQLELEDDSLSFPVGQSRNSVSTEIPLDNLSDSQLTAMSLTEHGTGKGDHDLGQISKGISGDNSSGSMIFKEEEDDETDTVFNSSTDSSSSSTNGESGEDMVTSTTPRTTEDLFAAIHRSKRKVLGRCDSDEERYWGFLSSLPVAPTNSCAMMPSMPRQNSFIQRGLRRSSTTNNNFKALLLKKGSRSDPGFRMSATEMLKCTDPRLQRANLEPLPSSPSPCASPGKIRRASEDWARTEGVLPRLSPSITPYKYGRSSTPPSAASSRYNSRSRIPSGPMTVICEREGELESTDCCLNVDIPFDMSLISSGMVCTQGT